MRAYRMALAACCAIGGLLPAAANAEPIGILIVPGSGHLVLHNEPGHCLRGARLAVWTDGTGSVPGCWVPLKREGEAVPSHVQVAFSDGDAHRYAIADFRPVQARAPGTTL